MELANVRYFRFRWASCQLDSVKKCLRPSALRKTLNELPATLDDTYDRILLAIDEQYHEEAATALIWLISSERLLYAEELAEAIAFNVGSDPAFNPNERLFDPYRILHVLSSLVLMKAVGDDNCVSLAHYSVKEYLTTRAFDGPALKFGVRQHDAQQQLLQNCLRYIEYDKGAWSWEHCWKDFPLSDYACNYWVEHAKNCGTHLTQDTKAMLVRVLSRPRLWTYLFDRAKWHHREELRSPGWTELRKHNYDEFADFRDPDSIGPKESESATAIYYAAWLGLAEVVQYMLQNGQAADEENGHHRTALQAASLKGEALIVSILLQNGADVNKRCGIFGNALHAACFGGEIATVKLLLNNGATVNGLGIFGGPLAAVRASSKPSPSIVTELLDRGCLNNSDFTTQAWLVYWAATIGEEEILLSVLDFMNMRGKSTFNWTRVGLHERDTESMSLAQRNRLGTAPHMAVFFNRVATARLLIPLWTNIDEIAHTDGTALYHACRNDSPDLAWILIAHGADIHTEGPNGLVIRYWTEIRNWEELSQVIDSICNSDVIHCVKCAAAVAVAEEQRKALVF